MAEEGERLQPKLPAEGAVGKLEPSPTSPEVKTGRLGIKITVASDGTVFTNPDDAQAYEQALRKARTGR